MPRYTLFYLGCVSLLLSLAAGAQQTLRVNSILFSTELPAPPPDSTTLFTIESILLEGNGKTRPATILRELSFEAGETYSLATLAELLSTARNALMRTGLFRNAALSLLRKEDKNVDIIIQVEERWYIFPMPFVKPVDYSFMEWMADENRSTRRINYGAFIAWNNFTGRNDQLQLSVVNGFSRQIGLQYNGLALDRDLRWMASLRFHYGRDRAVNLIDGESRRVFAHTPANDFVRQYYHVGAEISYRRAIKTRHSVGWSYGYESIDDTVFSMNPGYEAEARRLQVVNIYYRMNYADVDLMAYPTRGRITELRADKSGFGGGISQWQVSVHNTWVRPWKSMIFNLTTTARLLLPFERPAHLRRIAEQGAWAMHGYRDYQMNGVAAGVARLSLARPIIGKTAYVPKALVPKRFDRFRAVPFRLYARGFLSAGYAHDPSERAGFIANQMLAATGLALDIVAFNDWVIKIEWSVNLLGQNRLYLQP